MHRSDYGDCSCSCNGIKDRSRRINTYSNEGGKACVGPLKEVVPCNTDPNCGEPEPVDCVMGSWSEWYCGER